MRPGLFRVAENGLMAASMASLAVFSILICLQVVARSISFPFYWADELLGIMFSVSVFFALPSVTGGREHLQVDFFLSSLTGFPKKILQFLIDLISFVYLASLSVLIAVLAIDSFDIDARSQGMLGVPQFIPQTLIVLGMVVSVLCLLSRRAPEDRSVSDPK